jgi:hypothetical protein
MVMAEGICSSRLALATPIVSGQSYHAEMSRIAATALSRWQPNHSLIRVVVMRSPTEVRIGPCSSASRQRTHSDAARRSRDCAVGVIRWPARRSRQAKLTALPHQAAVDSPLGPLGRRCPPLPEGWFSPIFSLRLPAVVVLLVGITCPCGVRGDRSHPLAWVGPLGSRIQPPPGQAEGVVG